MIIKTVLSDRLVNFFSV